MSQNNWPAGMTEAIEDSARRIADQGRGELVNQLRPAFEQAAQAHADVLEISPERLQEMIERGVDRASGLQWRHALATVAARELDIGLGEALSHPAVERAHEISGAPADSVSVPPRAAAPSAPAGTEPEARAQPAPEPEPEQTAQTESQSVPEAEDRTQAPPRSMREPRRLAEPRRPGEGSEPRRLSERQQRRVRTPEPDEDAVESEQSEETAAARRAGATVVRIAVVHLGGIANLTPGENALELRLSPAGLDIGRGGGEMVGRLSWREIRAIDVPPPRGLRRKRQGGSQLVVRTPNGEASFEVPELSADELREQLRTLLARHQRRLRTR